MSEWQSLNPDACMMITSKALAGTLSAWYRVKISRHARRPRTLDYVQALCTDFIEMHGDRLGADDPAVVGGFARLDGQPVMILGHQKGKDTRTRVARNFGMASPQGFRKAIRLMELTARFGHPLLTFIDTPGAYPGITAEEQGQHEAIAQSIVHMLRLPVPVVVTVIGEGGSGGALGLGAGDALIMLENAWYSVISPDGCASILWRSSAKAREAAEALKLAAHDLFMLGIVDEVVPEPAGGAHKDRSAVFEALQPRLLRHLTQLKTLSPEQLLKKRYDRYRRIGYYRRS